MTCAYVECKEVVGKTIHALRIYRNDGDGTELQIDFPDGTTFTCCFCVAPALEASFIRPGVGHPEVIRNYDLNQLSGGDVSPAGVIGEL